MRARRVPSETARRLGAMLQQQRQRHGLSQGELARRAGLSLKYVGEIERAEANVTVDAIDKIANALGWDPWLLFSPERAAISQAAQQFLVTEIDVISERLQNVGRWLAAMAPPAPHSSPPGPIGK
jgi:transcriptional regulator with XRE-family HTH domain